MSEKLRIGVLVSGSGSNLQAIMEACKDGRINGEVVVVGSDKPNAYGLERATKEKIPIFVVDYKEIKQKVEKDIERLESSGRWFNLVYQAALVKLGVPSLDYKSQEGITFLTRIIAEGEILKHLNEYRIDLLVLAGFMKLLSPYIIDQLSPGPLEPRIMNIHPALLPAFPGEDGYGDTYRYGCKAFGATVHFVDYGEDTGPIIDQAVLKRKPLESLDEMKERGLKAEWKLYPRCIQLFAEKRLMVMENESGRRVVETLPKKRRKG